MTRKCSVTLEYCSSYMSQVTSALVCTRTILAVTYYLDVDNC